MVRKLLIANRGEIAARIARTARRMGYTTVAVYSDADASSPHVAIADEAVRIGPAAPRDSYLDIDALIAAAKHTGADAIHPGYGFLAESAAFAECCASAGLVFVGPPAAAIGAMADKAAARRSMRAAGVPITPGFDASDADDATLAREAARIGFPVMVKAAAGGGGRGMRRVARAQDLAAALAGARAEAQAAFGDGTLFLEKLVEPAHHIEVQIFGDMHGTVVHLGERDCSVQRRHQKLIEETPAPRLPADLRVRLCRAAVEAARAVGYVNAGTVEFLWDGAEAFYFMEMNTRLQVEHPVTELVTGIDLVEWQLRIARGEALPLRQDEIRAHGHAIEARLCAEDPRRDFAPASGSIVAWQPSAIVRVDHALAAPSQVPTEYDSMLAKLIAWGETRDDARRRLVAALRETVLLGVPTNRVFLAAVLEHPRFVANEVTTGFVAEMAGDGVNDAPIAAPLALAAALLHEGSTPYRGPREWFNWRSTGPAPIAKSIECRGDVLSLALEALGPHAYRVEVDGRSIAVSLDGAEGTLRDVAVDDMRQRIAAVFVDDALHLALPHADLAVRDTTHARARRVVAGSDGSVLSPITGRVIAVPFGPGADVVRGDVVCVIEAMKMEHRITAPLDGYVAELRVAAGAQAAAGSYLMRIEPRSETSQREQRPLGPTDAR